MHNTVRFIALLSMITCNMHAAENTINKLDEDGTLLLHRHVDNELGEDSRKAGIVALIIKAKASVYELPKNNKSALDLALKRAQKFPKTLEVIQAAAFIEGLSQTTASTQPQGPYQQQLYQEAQKTIKKHAATVPPIAAVVIMADLDRRFNPREERKF